jgi:ABC-2 type transport system ATP-binding protein
MKPVIEATNLTRRFDEVTAVDDLSLTVGAGEVFGCLGHNGAGKTTTVRLLNGVLAPSDGAARVLDMSPSEEGATLRRRTGVLTETPSLDERLTGRENLTIYADLFGVPPTQVDGRVRDLLEMFELSDRADEKVSGYSKGMKQRLALARALLHEPELLFLDEPTSGLDPVATRDVHQMITRLSREEGRTVFLCTHNLNEAQQLCDRVGVMEHGRLLALGAPADLAAQVQKSLRLEIEVEESSRDTALEIIRRRNGLQPETGPDSGLDGVITVTGAHREQIPDLLADLVAAGVRLYRANPQEPSLSDVYFALHESTTV